MADPPPRTHPAILAVSWLFVSLPLGWGIYETLKKALALFG